MSHGLNTQSAFVRLCKQLCPMDLAWIFLIHSFSAEEPQGSKICGLLKMLDEQAPSSQLLQCLAHTAAQLPCRTQCFLSFTGVLPSLDRRLEPLQSHCLLCSELRRLLWETEKQSFEGSAKVSYRRCGQKLRLCRPPMKLYLQNREAGQIMPTLALYHYPGLL